MTHSGGSPHGDGSEFSISTEEFFAAVDENQDESGTTSSSSRAPDRFTTTSETRTQRRERAADATTATTDSTTDTTDARTTESARATVTRTGAEQLESARATDQQDQRRRGPDRGVRRAADETADATGTLAGVRRAVRDRPGGEAAAGILAVGAAPAVAEPTPVGEVGLAALAGGALVVGAGAAEARRRGLFDRAEIPASESVRDRPEIPVGRGRVEREIPVSESVRDRPEIPVSESARGRPEIEPTGRPAQNLPEIPVGGGGGTDERVSRRRDDTVVPEEFPLPGRDFPADPRRDVVRRRRTPPSAEAETVVDRPVQPGDLVGPRGPTIDDTGRERVTRREFPTGGEAVVGRDEATEPTIPFEEALTPAVAQSQEGPTRDFETFGPPQPGGPARILEGVGAGAGAAGAADGAMGEAPGMLDESDRVVQGDETAPGVVDDAVPGVDTTAPTGTGTGTGDDFLVPPAPEFGPETPPDFGTPGETVFPDEPALETPTGTETGEIPGLGDPTVPGPGTPGPGPGPGPGGLPLGAFPGGSAAPADEPRGGVFERVFRNPVADPVEFIEGDDDRRRRRGRGGLFGDVPDFDDLGGGGIL